MNPLDDHEPLLRSMRAGLTRAEVRQTVQRVALAAAMAERWLPVYEVFSAAEQWGDPANLRRSLDAVWNHLRGRLLSSSDSGCLISLMPSNPRCTRPPGGE